MKTKNELEMKRRNEPEMNGGLKMRKIEIVEMNYTPAKTVINQEPNKMWDDDIIKMSAEINIETADNCSYHFYVKSDNITDAFEEVKGKIAYAMLIYEDYSFEELGLPNPTYSTYDDGDGEFTSTEQFHNANYGEIHIPNEEEIKQQLEEIFKSMIEFIIL